MPIWQGPVVDARGFFKSGAKDKPAETFSTVLKDRLLRTLCFPAYRPLTCTGMIECLPYWYFLQSTVVFKRQLSDFIPAYHKAFGAGMAAVCLAFPFHPLMKSTKVYQNRNESTISISALFRAARNFVPQPLGAGFRSLCCTNGLPSRPQRGY